VPQPRGNSGIRQARRLAEAASAPFQRRSSVHRQGVSAGATAPSAVASPVGGGGTVFTFPDVSESPSVVSGLPSGAVQVAANIAGQFGTALLPDGNVWAWSVDSNTDNFGELGDGTTIDRTNPEPVHNLGGVTYIAAGSAHALAVDSGGSVWAWGDNEDGQLGDGTTTSHYSPEPIALSNVSLISAGDLTAARCSPTARCWAGQARDA
jgi:hypothetical protein